MFTLEDQIALMVNGNPRAEVHGKEKKPAYDIGLQVEVDNNILNYFSPDLKASLYRKQDEAQEDLIEENHLPTLRFPLLEMPLKWKKDFAGYQAIFAYGIGGPSNIHLSDCKINNISFECKQGGTVTMKFRILAHPDSVDSGKLNMLVQQEVTISLIPPTEGAQIETAERTEARSKLHDLFAPGDGPPDPKNSATSSTNRTAK